MIIKLDFSLSYLEIVSFGYAKRLLLVCRRVDVSRQSRFLQSTDIRTVDVNHGIESNRASFQHDVLVTFMPPIFGFFLLTNQQCYLDNQEIVMVGIIKSLKQRVKAGHKH